MMNPNIKFIIMMLLINLTNNLTSMDFNYLFPPQNNSEPIPQKTDQEISKQFIQEWLPTTHVLLESNQSLKSPAVQKALNNDLRNLDTALNKQGVKNIQLTRSAVQQAIRIAAKDNPTNFDKAARVIITTLALVLVGSAIGVVGGSFAGIIAGTAFGMSASFDEVMRADLAGKLPAMLRSIISIPACAAIGAIGGTIYGTGLGAVKGAIEGSQVPFDRVSNKIKSVAKVENQQLPENNNSLVIDENTNTNVPSLQLNVQNQTLEPSEPQPPLMINSNNAQQTVENIKKLHPEADLRLSKNNGNNIIYLNPRADVEAHLAQLNTTATQAKNQVEANSGYEKQTENHRYYY